MKKMTLQLFWKIIDDTRNEANTYEDMIDPLVKILSDLEIADIVTWQQIFDEYQKLSYKTKLWAAAYIINGGCSDDGFDYFRSWLTIQGKEIFLEALLNPDSLVKLDIDEDEVVEFEDMLYAGPHAFTKKQDIETDDNQDIFYEEFDKHPLSEEIKEEMLAEIQYAEDIDMEWDDDTDFDDILPDLCRKFICASSDNSGFPNPLIEAAENGNLEKIKELVKNGADVNSISDYGDTALMLASQYGQLEVVKYLLEKSADIHTKDEDGKTALMWASENGYTKIVELLKSAENGSLEEVKE